jgi:hypothetical protein
MGLFLKLAFRLGVEFKLALTVGGGVIGVLSRFLLLLFGLLGEELDDEADELSGVELDSLDWSKFAALSCRWLDLERDDGEDLGDIDEFDEDEDDV